MGDLEIFYVYMVTNANRTVLYTGVTNDLQRRLFEHYEASQTDTGFTGRYKAHHLIYFEEFDSVNDAIAREKQIKGWTRSKKEALINSVNPKWKFLETEI